MKKKVLIVLAIILVIITISVIVSKANSGGDSTFTDDPVFTDDAAPNSETSNKTPEHLSEVPDGYIGIYTPDDLKNVTLNTTANYIIMNDIDMSGTTFDSIENFTGIFNGNNYEIQNYKSNYPIFKSISDATIENLHFTDAIVEQSKDGKDVGGIIGTDAFKTTNRISNCTYRGKITAHGTSEIKNSIYVGGIIGDAFAFTTIENCAFSGEIEVVDGYVASLGGVVGYLGEKCSDLNNCFSTGSFIADEVGDFGGICGSACKNIYNCYSSCSIDVKSQVKNVGGIVGSLENGTVKSVYYNGAIKTSAEKVGAIAAYVYSDYNTVNQLQYCYYSQSDISAVGDGTPYANVAMLSTDEMNSKKNFNGFDFENVWSMGNGKYKFPVLKSSYYSPTTYDVSDTEDNESQRTYNISDIESAFKQSVLNNSVDYIKPYLHPKAQEILNNAYNKGQDTSVLADLNCTIDGFYDESKQFDNNTTLKKSSTNFDESDLSDMIFEDINDVSGTDDITAIAYSEFKYSTDACDSSCTLIIVKTQNNGAFLLAIDD